MVHITPNPAASASTSSSLGSDGDDAVTTARFTWNGRDLVPGEPEIQSHASSYVSS